MTCISNTSVKLIKIGNQHFFYAGVCVYVHACVWMGGWRASTVLLFSVSRPVYKGTSLGDCVFTWCLSHDHINTQKKPYTLLASKNGGGQMKADVLLPPPWKLSISRALLRVWGPEQREAVMVRKGGGWSGRGVCVCAWVEGWGPTGLIKGQEGWESCSLI